MSLQQGIAVTLIDPVSWDPSPPPDCKGITSTSCSTSNLEEQRLSSQKPPRWHLRILHGIILALTLAVIIYKVTVVTPALTLVASEIAKPSPRHGNTSHSQNRPKTTIHPRDLTTTNLDPDSMPGPGNDFAASQAPVRLGILTNFPDPTLHYESSSETWFAFGTNDGVGFVYADLPVDPVDTSIYNTNNLQVATSTDFKTWKLHEGDSGPLPDPGSWAMSGEGTIIAQEGQPKGELAHAFNGTARDGTLVSIKMPKANVWSPDILKRPSDGKYILYYAAKAKSDGIHCIGAAVADTVLGPFTPSGPEALICNSAEGGTIDPVAFVDSPTIDKRRVGPAPAYTRQPKQDGKIYLTYKIDGNARGHGGECGNTVKPVHPTPIMMQELSSDGLTLAPGTEPKAILDRIASDGPLIEAPQLIKAGDTYFLFYNSGCPSTDDYTIHYATADHVKGPYSRAGRPGVPPLLNTGQYGLTAPGSVGIRFVSEDGKSDSSTLGGSDGHWKITLHGRVETGSGGIRAMFTAGLDINGHTVKIVA